VRSPRCAGSLDIAVSGSSGLRHRYTRLESSGALAARATPAGLFLVGAAAQPIGGDELEIRLALDAGAELDVRSVGATLARRAAPGDRSVMRTDVVLGDRAVLRWMPEPGIAAAGASHLSSTRVALASTSRLAWHEDVVLGRHGEVVPGSWTSRLEVLVCGRPLLVAELGLGPAAPTWELPSGLGGARAVSTLVLVYPPWRSAPPSSQLESTESGRGMLLPLEGPAVQMLAWGDDLRSCRTLIGRLLERGRGMRWHEGRAEMPRHLGARTYCDDSRK